MNTPQWQTLTGLTPEAEAKLSPEERDAKIRILLAEVERRAQAELDRADKCPAGERTVYWDPVEAACQDLGIARVKLSAYARRLRGIRAQEIGDKLKAKLLKPSIEAWVKEQFDTWWQFFGEKKLPCDPNDFYPASLGTDLGREFADGLKFRTRDLANRFALKLGFANITRLRKAVVLAFDTTLDALLRRAAFTIVQKCVDEIAKKGVGLAAKPANNKGATANESSNRGAKPGRAEPPLMTPLGPVPESLLKKIPYRERISDEELERREKEFEESLMRDEVA